MPRCRTNRQRRLRRRRRHDTHLWKKRLAQEAFRQWAFQFLEVPALALPEPPAITIMDRTYTHYVDTGPPTCRSS